MDLRIAKPGSSVPLIPESGFRAIVIPAYATAEEAVLIPSAPSSEVVRLKIGQHAFLRNQIQIKPFCGCIVMYFKLDEMKVSVAA
jgi:hypothetical protein